MPMMHACTPLTHTPHLRTRARKPSTNCTHTTRASQACMLRTDTTHARIPCTPCTPATLSMHYIAYLTCVHACMGCVTRVSSLRAKRACLAWMRACGDCVFSLQACVVSITCMCVIVIFNFNPASSFKSACTTHAMQHARPHTHSRAQTHAHIHIHTHTHTQTHLHWEKFLGTVTRNLEVKIIFNNIFRVEITWSFL